MSTRWLLNAWYWFLDKVPMWARTRWPMKKFFWQKEEIEEAKRFADILSQFFPKDSDE